MLSGLAIKRFNKILDETLNGYSVLDNKDKSYFFARRVRKGRKVLFPLVFHAGAGGIANFVTTRERKAVCVRLDYQRIRQIERNSCCRLDSSNTVAKTCHFQLSIFYIRDFHRDYCPLISSLEKRTNQFALFPRKQICPNL